MSNRRAGLGIVAVILALVVIVVLSGPREDPYLRPRLDPRSTGPEGLAALVGVLQASGVPVARGGLPDASDAIAFQSEDTLSGSAATGLATWVRRGGTLVVADPESPLATQDDFAVDDRSTLPGTCGLTALRGVTRLGVALPRALVPDLDDSSCFADEQGAGLVAHRLGAGIVVTISSVDPFLDEYLGRGDDAALAVSLLAPTPGRQVRILDANQFFAGDQVSHRGVLDALGKRTSQALWELGLAFLVWALFRGRRLGKVVPEELPVNVPSSDLVLAVGEMLGRGEDLGAIAERLRRRARRELGVAVGLGAAPDPDDLMAALHNFVTLDADGLRRALRDPVPDLASLLAVCDQLDRLMKESSMQPMPPSDPGSVPAPAPPDAAPPQPSAPQPALAPSAAAPSSAARDSVLAIRGEVGKVVIGQDPVLACVLAAMLVGGHVLLEGVPGVAKTLLVKALATALDLDMRRIQFTPDLMPSDITGQLVLEDGRSGFTFRPGPIFTNLCLADEINRTPPKTQAALLEAMEERQVSVGGETRLLPDPFIVIATQNPVEYEGTYPLPEAQLDRFLFKVRVPYPSAAAEEQILVAHDAGIDVHDPEAAGVRRVAGAAELAAARSEIDDVHVDPLILRYIVSLVRATRDSPSVSLGVSPRGGAALLHATKAWAWLSGRGYAIPDDVKAVAGPALRHRLAVRAELALEGITPDRIIENLLVTVPAPR